MELKQSKINKLTAKLILHLKILGFAIVMVGVIAYLNKMKINSDKAVFLFGVIYIQLEYFIWLGRVLFKFEPGQNPKEITFKIISRYIQFHILCFIGAAVIYLSLLSLLYLKNSTPLADLLPNVIKWDLKGWLIATNIGLLFGAFIFFFMQWQEALKKTHKLREEKLAFQFETLNNQVNPHFLFNSLNTLSSFIATQPEVAEEYVHKLSAIYRYITDNVSKNQIALNDEIQFIKDYFYLHKLRDEDKIQLIVNVPEDNLYQIIPVSLQLLIENALKHNMATKENPLIVTVQIEGSNVVVVNNLQKKTTLETSLKKGLSNLKERVTLSTGKQVELIETKTTYTVKVPLI